MGNNGGLIFGYCLDGRGGGRTVGWDDVAAWTPGDGALWLHLDYAEAEAKRWLEEKSGIDAVVCETLTAEGTRPRCMKMQDGLLVILRGINLNPGAEPDDMVSLRIWVDEHRVLTFRHRRVQAIQDLRKALESGDGPGSPAVLLEELASRLIERAGALISDLDDRVDAREDEVLTQESHKLRPQLADIRRAAISLRRHLSPQREVLARLQVEKVSWLDDLQRARLRETADMTMRHVEDLDSIRERAAVTQEELNSRLAEQMNKTMYVLSIVAGIFLPLGLLTGLLGINVGGMPGTDNAAAFGLVCIVLVALAIVEVYVLRRMKWM